jgi:hypothetical protein
MDIVYSVKKIERHDGKTEYGAYENNNLIETFVSAQRAWWFIKHYKKVMR